MEKFYGKVCGKVFMTVPSKFVIPFLCILSTEREWVRRAEDMKHFHLYIVRLYKSYHYVAEPKMLKIQYRLRRRRNFEVFPSAARRRREKSFSFFPTQKKTLAHFPSPSSIVCGFWTEFFNWFCVCARRSAIEKKLNSVESSHSRVYQATSGHSPTNDTQKTATHEHFIPISYSRASSQHNNGPIICLRDLNLTQVCQHSLNSRTRSASSEKKKCFLVKAKKRRRNEMNKKKRVKSKESGRQEEEKRA